VAKVSKSLKPKTYCEEQVSSPKQKEPAYLQFYVGRRIRGDTPSKRNPQLKAPA
jgi:hypothetical protein